MVTIRDKSQLSVAQVRMARVGLGLGVRDLAKLADVSPNTVSRFERGEKLHRRTLKAIREALEEAGAVFVKSDDGHDGVVIKEN